MSKLAKYRGCIKEERPFVDLKPYSHNLISISLQQIAKGFGKAEANKAIKDFRLRVADKMAKVIKNGNDDGWRLSDITEARDLYNEWKGLDK